MLDDGTGLYDAPELYDLEYTAYLGDLDFYLDICARTQPEAVLELGCGSGRLTIPMARAGTTVHGIDLSPPMLERLLLRLSAEPDLRPLVTAELADARRWRSAGSRFGAVIAPFNMVQHLDQQGLIETLACAGACLTPRGLLAFDLYAPVGLEQSCEGDDFSGAEKLPSAPSDPGVYLAQRKRFDPDNRILMTSLRYTQLAPSGAVASERTLALNQRQWRAEELIETVRRAGFLLESCYGDLDRTPLSSSSPRLLLIARPKVAG